VRSVLGHGTDFEILLPLVKEAGLRSVAAD
jgi:hypothetical protein